MSEDRDTTFEFSKEAPRWGRVTGAILVLVCVGFIVAAIWTGDDRWSGFAWLAGFLAFVVGAEFKIEAKR